MATVQDTNDKLEFVARLLDYARASLLRANDIDAYHNLAQCLTELSCARLYVAESEAREEVIGTASRKLRLAMLGVQEAISALLGEPHRQYNTVDSSVTEVEPDRTYAMSQLCDARRYVLETDNALALDLVSGAPLGTYMRLLEHQIGPCEQTHAQ